jgi:uncharacterized protein YycO
MLSQKLMLSVALSCMLLSGNVTIHENRLPQNSIREIFIADSSKATLTSGDIIFQVTQSGQSKAIQLATHSPYSHCGLIFFEKGKCMVWEAGPVVTRTDFKTFVERGRNGVYVVNRLRKYKEEFSSDSIQKKMSDDFYRNYYNKPYDLYFNWSDEKIYCSELVWKLYKNATGLEIGKPEKMKDFDLSNPIVKEQLKQRYGNNIPMEETVISPAQIFNSDLLETVISK